MKSPLFNFGAGVLVGNALGAAIVFLLFLEDCRCNIDASAGSSKTATAKTNTDVSGGGLLNFQQSDAQAVSLSSNNSSTTNTGNVIENESKSPNADGWHPVYVYSGGINNTATSNGPTGAGGSSSTKPRMVVDRLPHNSVTFRGNFVEYGSQEKQDQVIMKLMDQFTSHQQSLCEKKGLPASTFSANFYFIDLAANDAIQLSNTLKLERLHLLHGDNDTSPFLKSKQHWKGLCIEPNPKYWYRLANRECTVVGAFVGTDVDGTIMNVTNLDLEVYGGIVGDNIDNSEAVRSNWVEEVDESQMEERAIVSLPTILKKFVVPEPYIDYLSLDVEGAEYLVMHNFPFETHKIRIITVERPKEDLRQLLKQNGYVYVMQLAFWEETLWVHESFLKRSSNKQIQEDDSAFDESCGLTLKEMQTFIVEVVGRKQIPKRFDKQKGFYGEEPW